MGPVAGWRHLYGARQRLRRAEQLDAVHMEAAPGQPAGGGQASRDDETAGRGQTPGMAVADRAQAPKRAGLRMAEDPAESGTGQRHGQRECRAEDREIEFPDPPAPGAEQSAGQRRAVRGRGLQEQAAGGADQMQPVVFPGMGPGVHGAAREPFPAHAGEEGFAARVVPDGFQMECVLPVGLAAGLRSCVFHAGLLFWGICGIGACGKSSQS